MSVVPDLAAPLQGTREDSHYNANTRIPRASTILKQAKRTDLTSDDVRFALNGYWLRIPVEHTLTRRAFGLDPVYDEPGYYWFAGDPNTFVSGRDQFGIHARPWEGVYVSRLPRGFSSAKSKTCLVELSYV